MASLDDASVSVYTQHNYMLTRDSQPGREPKLGAYRTAIRCLVVARVSIRIRSYIRTAEVPIHTMLHGGFPSSKSKSSMYTAYGTFILYIALFLSTPDDPRP